MMCGHLDESNELKIVKAIMLELFLATVTQNHLTIGKIMYSAVYKMLPTH